jgi:hypothetical protein
VTRLAVRVALVHRETNIVINIELAITRDRQPATPRRRWKERVPTLRTKKVLLVISPLSQRIVVKRDEPLVNNCRFAVIATRHKVLRDIRVNNCCTTKRGWENEPRGNRDDNRAFPRVQSSRHAQGAHCTRSNGNTLGASAVPSH